MSSILKISDHTKKVLSGIFIIISISFLVAYIYYNGKNKAEDPRIVKTKYMFKQFDEQMKVQEFSSAFSLLDSIESILVEVQGYKDSYEL